MSLREGNRGPVRGTDGPVRETEGPVTGTGPLLIARNAFQLHPFLLPGTGKRGRCERGLFAGGISGISTISRFSRISRKWSDSPLLSTIWGFSKISRLSKFSRISRKWTFLKRPLFQKTLFPNLSYSCNCWASRGSLRKAHFYRSWPDLTNLVVILSNRAPDNWVHRVRSVPLFRSFRDPFQG